MADNKRGPALQKRNYNHPLSPPNRKLKRRVEAEARQELYDSLSIEERIARAEERRGDSLKELALLNALLEVST